jgi:hypothetical protein
MYSKVQHYNNWQDLTLVNMCHVFTVVPIEAFRKMLTSSFPVQFEEFLWTIPQQFDKFLKKFLTSCFIDQSNLVFYFWAIWLVHSPVYWWIKSYVIRQSKLLK